VQTKDPRCDKQGDLTCSPEMLASIQFEGMHLETFTSALSVADYD
jgi:hypothetical protein